VEKEVESVEDSFINTFLNMVLKINEMAFKPLFMRITHWSSEIVDAAKADEEGSGEDEGSDTLRRLPNFARVFFFWRLINALADKLKVVTALLPISLLSALLFG